VFEAAKLGIWVFLATEILLFGGLFTAYIMYRMKYPDLFHAEHLKLNRYLGLANTLVLITSSLSMACSIAAIRRGRQMLSRACIAVTILLALGFLGVKYVEWTEDFAHGLYPGTNMFFSLYFMMTGLHGLHVGAGICVLIVILIQAYRGKFSEQYATPIEITGIYWHFVDLVWIYLFPLFYLIG
jgi:cytochrome c oxidase subunit 3